MANDQKLTLTVQVNADTGQLEVLGAKMKQTGDAAKSAFANFLPAASAAAILGFFVKAVEGAEEENESLRRLSSTITTNGGNWEANRQKVLNWTQSVQELTRFSDSQALNALDKLTRTTGNLTQGMSASKLAMDLSVKTGKDLSETIQIVNNLILGQSRALLEARREFGTMAGSASTAQGVLDALAKSSAGAAAQEQDLTKEVSLAKNAWREFMDLIGNVFAPVAVALAKTLTGVLKIVEALGTEIAGFVKEASSGLTGLWTVLREGAQGNFAAAAAASKQTMKEIVSDHIATQELVAEVFRATNEKVKQDFEKSANDRLLVNHSLTAEEVKAKQEAANELVKLESQMDQEIAKIGVQTLAKKQAALNAEVSLKKAAIDKEVKLGASGAEAYVKLEQYKKIASDQIAKQHLLDVQNNYLTSGQMAVQALQVLNSLGETGSAAERVRAKALLVLQQGLAIGWAVVAAHKVAAETTPIGGAIYLASSIALIAAQTAAGFRAIDKSASQEASGMQGVNINPAVPGIDLGAVGSPGGGVTTFSGGGASPGGGGGGGGGNVINVGGIVVNFSTDKLGIDNVTVVMQAMYEKIRQATIEGVQLAVAMKNLADANGTKAV